MELEIETKIIQQPTHKSISVACPGCSASISREVPIESTSGLVECRLCHCEFEWKEVS